MPVDTYGEFKAVHLGQNADGDYLVKWGEFDKNSRWRFETAPYVLPGKTDMTCFGIILLSPETAVMDCSLHYSRAT